MGGWGQGQKLKAQIMALSGLWPSGAVGEVQLCDGQRKMGGLPPHTLRST